MAHEVVIENDEIVKYTEKYPKISFRGISLISDRNGMNVLTKTV